MSESVCLRICRHIGRHDESLIMKLCMYVGYNDANNVSNFGGDQVTQLNLKNVFKNVYTDAATGFAAFATRPRASCWSMEDRRWPYQPKHSPSQERREGE